MFKRDKKKFSNNFEFLDENPLGVCALSGTSFNIDRNYTTKRLNFKKPTNNSVDTVSDRDFVIATLVPPTVEVETKTEETAEEGTTETTEEKTEEKKEDNKEENKESK